MKTVITQDDYNKVYDEIMELVSYYSIKPKKEVKYFCISPEAFEDAKFSYNFNMLHKDELSLSEREYGQFIDAHYKEAIIKAICDVFMDEELGRLKWDIAMAIRTYYGISGKGESLISKKDYYEFYSDVMECLRNGDKPYRTDMCYCDPPDPSIIIKRYSESTIIDQLFLSIEHELSLGDVEYGRFIDDNFKLVIIRAMIDNDESNIIQLKKEIAYAISKRFHLDDPWLCH